MLKKIFLLSSILLVGLSSNLNSVFASESNSGAISSSVSQTGTINEDKKIEQIKYDFFYGNGCPHCAKVEEFFEKNETLKKFNITSIEVYNDDAGRQKFLDLAKKLNLDLNNLGIPFLYYEENGISKYLSGDTPIIEYFKNTTPTLTNQVNTNTGNTELCKDGNEYCKKPQANTNDGNNFWNRMKFFGVLLPAAISDSINPCEFAIIILLLGSILTLHKDRKKVYLAGILFSLAIFLSYFLMGLGLYKALASVTNLNSLKITVGVIGILVGLANMKDYFWYGKWFVMEVPFSWRPAMQNLIKKVTSPIGAFFVGIIISLFLLPCTSGPYLTVLGYLASESKNINTWGIVYLLVYNIIFILPMLIITFIIGSGAKTPGEVREFKEANLEKIHLIVGFLMIGLGLYLLNDVYGIVKITIGG